MSDNKNKIPGIDMRKVKTIIKDGPGLCIHAQDVNQDRDFYCHFFKEFDSCKYPKCDEYINACI